MLEKLIQFFLLLAALGQIQCSYTPTISTEILPDYPSNVSITPYTKVGDGLYYFSENQVNWYRANLICRAMGAFLASIETPEESAAMSNYLDAHYPRSRWWYLSGSNLHAQGVWSWYRTGERMVYANWAPGQPDNAGGNEHCTNLWWAVKTQSYQMNDIICTRPLYYICQASKPITVAVTIL